MARKHEQSYVSIGVGNEVVFNSSLTAVYSGLQRLAAFKSDFQNDKSHKVVKIFGINPWWVDIQALPLANSLRQKK